MVILIALPQSLQDGDRLINGRLLHLYWLESALQGRILLDYFLYSFRVVAPMHCNSPRASAGFKILECIDGAFRRASTHHGMQLINEEDNFAGAG